jgi:hypothetical protein
MSGQNEDRIIDRPAISLQRHPMADSILDIEPAFGHVGFHNQAAAFDRSLGRMQVAPDRSPAVIVTGEHFQLAGQVAVIVVGDADRDDVFPDSRLTESVESGPGPGVNPCKVVHIDDDLVVMFGQRARVLPSSIGLVGTHPIGQIRQVVQCRMGDRSNAAIGHRVLDRGRELGRDFRGGKTSRSHLSTPLPCARDINPKVVGYRPRPAVLFVPRRVVVVILSYQMTAVGQFDRLGRGHRRMATEHLHYLFCQV